MQKPSACKTAVIHLTYMKNKSSVISLKIKKKNINVQKTNMQEQKKMTFRVDLQSVPCLLKE